MNWMDIVILSLLALGTGFGIKSGLVWQLGKLVALVGAIIATAWLHEPVGNCLARNMANETGAHMLSFTLTFIVAYAGVWLVTWLLEWKLRKHTGLKTADRVFGGAIGLVKTSLIIGAVLMGFAVYAVLPVEETMSESFMAKYLVMGMQKVAVAIPGHYRQDLSRFCDRAYDYAKGKGTKQLNEAWEKVQEKTVGKPTPATPPTPPAKQGK